ncbi:type II toxin-antitoxin system YafO family toxin [Hahella ganghwensis]|uniref:type II toxin-antitoxin system YafO family toxin n=1 Tax=Hahella ganghwensis TaxID=286420 RepID=UPI00037ABDC1|nr:type II toxin-antitoxin system YafO family toxin [Hahella ganghwensis]
MAIEVFLSPNLQLARKANPKITEIRDAFKLYNETGNAGLIFGRYGEMLRPPEAMFEELNHIHILQGSPSYLRRLQVRNQYERKSDSFLVFCPGFHSKDNVLMIDILWEDAHKRTEDMWLMDEYIKVAKRFRARY